MTDRRELKNQWNMADDFDRQLREQLQNVDCPSEALVRWKLAIESGQTPQELEAASQALVYRASGDDASSMQRDVRPAWQRRRALLLVLAASILGVAVSWTFLGRGSITREAVNQFAQEVLNSPLEQHPIMLADLPWFEAVGSQLSLSQAKQTETLRSAQGAFAGTIIKIAGENDELYVMAYPISRSLGFSQSLSTIPSTTGGWAMAAMESKGVLVVIATKGSLGRWIDVNAFT